MDQITFSTKTNRIRAYIHPSFRESIDNPLKRALTICNANRIIHDMVVLPDFHYKVGNFIPTGTVTVTNPDRIIPCAVGNGSGCGYSMIKLGINKNDITPQDIDALFREFMKHIPIMSVPGKFKKSFCLDAMNNGLDAVASCSKNIKSKYDYQGNIFKDHEFIDVDRDYKKFMPSENYNKIFSDLEVLGGGNHFLELLKVEDIIDKDIADHLSLHKDELYINFHSDSIGVGDISRNFTPYKTFRNLTRIKQELKKMAFHLKFYRHLLFYIKQDQIFSVPTQSRASRQFLSFIFASTNYGFVNRFLICKKIMEIVTSVLKYTKNPDIFIDNLHDLISFEDGLWVHRTGATRVTPKKETKEIRYSKYGKPVIIPIALGACTFIGVPGKEVANTYQSLPHGAGRRIDRSLANDLSLNHLNETLINNGMRLYRHGLMDIAREHPSSFRDADTLRECLEGFGLMKIIAVLKPLAVLKA